MREAPAKRLSKKALPVWRITGFLESLFYLIFPVGYGIVLVLFDWPLWILYVLILMWIAVALLQSLLVPAIRWRRWRYEVYEEEIDLQYGVFIIRRTLIPMIRVQHVDTEHGPIYRHYKLAAVSISTAATVHQIPALTEETASDLRDQIAVFAQTADEDE
ncbi:PH domain-containing protein [Salicibibacter cibi]|uniref:PH domain-containing protein n=1 Tax=Salicibibacter cibi TaxID=2743001 RepID=A0A7T6ZAV2_9BACI|nr:PH domain-containing protein [Salicibibacter cibi]QQK79947.1 PH domain-containing protein [Salicibibacter cibi]